MDIKQILKIRDKQQRFAHNQHKYFIQTSNSSKDRLEIQDFFNKIYQKIDQNMFNKIKGLDDYGK